MLQLVQHTRLETFRQSRVVVVVVVVVAVGAYSPVTDNHARQLRGAARRVTTLDRWILLLRIAAPVLAVAGTGVDESPAVLGDAPPPLGSDALFDKGSLTALAKGSAGDAALSEDAAGVSTSLLARSRM